VVLTTGGEEKAMILFAALCVVAGVAARTVFPKEVKEELHEEMEEIKEHGHHADKDDASEEEPKPADSAANEEKGEEK
jgi:UDP-GlcNAc:undecaprenyl-phosphate GlcNAc-1-phosphate transferase